MFSYLAMSTALDGGGAGPQSPPLANGGLDSMRHYLLCLGGVTPAMAEKKNHKWIILRFR